MTDFRALCAELVEAWDDLPWEWESDFKGTVAGIHSDLYDDIAVARARAALAKPIIPLKQRVFPTPSQAAECGGPCYEGNYCPEACDCGLYQMLLSPAAQAVLDTALDAEFCIEFSDLEATMKASVKRVVAAAICAAAAHLPSSAMYPSSDWGHGWRAGINDARQALLAIAAELEGSND